jgi:hypothetical protein
VALIYSLAAFANHVSESFSQTWILSLVILGFIGGSQVENEAFGNGLSESLLLEWVAKIVLTVWIVGKAIVRGRSQIRRRVVWSILILGSFGIGECCIANYEKTAQDVSEFLLANGFVLVMTYLHLPLPNEFDYMVPGEEQSDFGLDQSDPKEPSPISDDASSDGS